MPYIKKEDRKKFDYLIKELINQKPTEGELNYIFTMLALGVLKNLGENYSTLNTIDGVFGCAQKEFYRRKIVPYEDKKIANPENGDVYNG